MPNTAKCNECGSKDLVSGRIKGRLTGFVPDGAPLLGTVNAATPIWATLCMKCARLTLRGDPGWVAKVLGRFEPRQP